MTARNIRDLNTAETGGQTALSFFRKNPTQTTAANIWFDLSMSPGNPVPNYYIGTPGVFTPLSRSADYGIPHAGIVAPLKQHLRVMGMMNVSAGAANSLLTMCDYLGFYPFIDESALGYQPFTKNIPLPRDPTGKGAQLMAVVVAGHAGGTVMRFTYTNQDGISGKVTPDHLMTAQQLVNGTILTSGTGVNRSHGPFIALAPGDTSALSVEGVEIDGSGDIGLFALVMVRPIATTHVRGIDAPTEIDFLIERSEMPVIEDDAYLNFICLPNGNLAGSAYYGYIKTLWV